VVWAPTEDERCVHPVLPGAGHEISPDHGTSRLSVDAAPENEQQKDDPPHDVHGMGGPLMDGRGKADRQLVVHRMDDRPRGVHAAVSLFWQNRDGQKSYGAALLMAKTAFYRHHGPYFLKKNVLHRQDVNQDVRPRRAVCAGGKRP